MNNDCVRAVSRYDQCVDFSHLHKSLPANCWAESYRKYTRWASSTKLIMIFPTFISCKFLTLQSQRISDLFYLNLMSFLSPCSAPWPEYTVDCQNPAVRGDEHAADCVQEMRCGVYVSLWCSLFAVRPWVTRHSSCGRPEHVLLKTLHELTAAGGFGCWWSFSPPPPVQKSFLSVLSALVLFIIFALWQPFVRSLKSTLLLLMTRLNTAGV